MVVQVRREWDGELKDGQVEKEKRERDRAWGTDSLIGEGLKR